MFSVFLIRAIIAVILISIVAATIGSFSVFRGSTFLVSGIAHGALAGAALGIFIALNFFSVEPLLVAMLFSILFALSIGYFMYQKENVDVAIGIMFAFSMSLAVLFLSMIREYASVAWGLIIGDVLLLTEEDINLLIVSVITIVLLFLIFYRKMLFSIFDPDSAEAMGIRPIYYETLLFVLIAIGVVSLLKCVGVILVYALLIVPAAASKRIAGNISACIGLAFIIALISGLLGIYLSFFISVAPSSLAGLVATAIYALTFLKR